MFCNEVLSFYKSPVLFLLSCSAEEPLAKAVRKYSRYNRNKTGGHLTHRNRKKLMTRSSGSYFRNCGSFKPTSSLGS